MQVFVTGATAGHEVVGLARSDASAASLHARGYQARSRRLRRRRVPRRGDRRRRAHRRRRGLGAACGRLLGYVEPHINSWDCLGALAVIRAAGGRTNDYLSGDALLTGNRIVAGPPAVFPALDAVLG